MSLIKEAIMQEEYNFDDTESTYKEVCKHCPRKLITTKSREAGICVSCRDYQDRGIDFLAGIRIDTHINNNLSYGDSNYGYHF
jgi:hypothetical protein